MYTLYPTQPNNATQSQQCYNQKVVYQQYHLTRIKENFISIPFVKIKEIAFFLLSLAHSVHSKASLISDSQGEIQFTLLPRGDKEKVMFFLAARSLRPYQSRFDMGVARGDKEKSKPFSLPPAHSVHSSVGRATAF